MLCKRRCLPSQCKSCRGHSRGRGGSTPRPARLARLPTLDWPHPPRRWAGRLGPPRACTWACSCQGSRAGRKGPLGKTRPGTPHRLGRAVRRSTLRGEARTCRCGLAQGTQVCAGHAGFAGVSAGLLRGIRRLQRPGARRPILRGPDQPGPVTRAPAAVVPGTATHWAVKFADSWQTGVAGVAAQGFAPQGSVWHQPSRQTLPAGGCHQGKVRCS